MSPSGNRVIYAVCWQDDCEPWGWEVLSLWEQRHQAEKAFEALCESEEVGGVYVCLQRQWVGRSTGTLETTGEIIEERVLR